MVNRVNSNENYNYTRLKMPDAADKTGDSDQFSLAYQHAQEESDGNDKEDKPDGLDVAKTGRLRTMMQSGVRLELSGNAQTLDAEESDSANQTQSIGQGLVDTVRSWITKFIQTVKEILYRIWNDSPPAEDTISTGDISDDTEEMGEPERLSEEYLALKKLEALQNPETAAAQQVVREAEREKEIQKLLRSGDIERVISLVTENGQKTMAKNSTLLTYYDRRGRIAPLSASDQERILHGDRSTRKL